MLARKIAPVEDEFDPELLQMLEPLWFRVEASFYSTVNEWGDVDGHYGKLTIRRLPVVKHTPKGAWLEVGFTGGPAKFVLREMQHRARAYAASTLHQAREDFRRRKLYRISKLQGQILRVQREIALLGDAEDGLRLQKPA